MNDSPSSFHESLADFNKKFESVNQTVITKKQFDEIVNHIISLENELPIRIFAKIIGLYLEPNIGRVVEVDNEKFLVALTDTQVTIERADSRYPDCAKVFIHETKEDAITAAALDPDGHFIEEEIEDEESDSPLF